MPSDKEQIPTTSSPSKIETCKICDQPSHGIHFGVSTCRACAAFYRRTIVLSKKYHCRKLTEKCDISSRELHPCRFCRFKKCLKIGMTTDNVQWNRDTQKATNRLKAETKISFFNEDAPGARHSIAKKKPVHDISQTLDEIRQILKQFDPSSDDPTYYQKNYLQRMERAFNEFRPDQNHRKPKICQNFQLKMLVDVWKIEMVKIAKWMMHAEEFRRLEIEKKFQCFEKIWMIWHKCERLIMSVEILGKRVTEEKLLLIDNYNAFPVDTYEIDHEKITDLDIVQIRHLFAPYYEKIIDEAAKPLVKIQPTSIEITYMLCHICSYFCGKFLDDETLKHRDHFLEEIGNNMHDYYVKERNMQKYASRLIKIMSVVNALQRIHVVRENIIEIANIFDVFKVPLINPPTPGS